MPRGQLPNGDVRQRTLVLVDLQQIERPHPAHAGHPIDHHVAGPTAVRALR
jgi:hypothetical protein